MNTIKGIVVIVLILLALAWISPKDRKTVTDTGNQLMATAGVKNPDLEKVVEEVPGNTVKFAKGVGDALSEWWNATPVAHPTARPTTPPADSPQQQATADPNRGGGVLQATSVPTSKPSLTASTPLIASISAQKPGNEPYQMNVRAFFAWPASGYELATLKKMNLLDFEGKVQIQTGTRSTSINRIFAGNGGNYDKQQGMVSPPDFAMGDGACNAGGLTAAALEDAGLKVDRDCPYHRALIPGTEGHELLTLCIPTPGYACSKTCDAWISNPYSQAITLHFKIQGDRLKLWVEGVPAK